MECPLRQLLILRCKERVRQVVARVSTLQLNHAIDLEVGWPVHTLAARRQDLQPKGGERGSTENSSVSNVVLMHRWRFGSVLI